LKDGTIVEQGSHEELLASRGYYFQLFRKQFLLREMELLGFHTDGAA
jgi:ABC-type transport system involved in cytochrome bd biosynthesis fused ATPase/permease subunit